ncbi:MAG: hypothetical protein CL840_10260 [Crocinitomicaceae bacterium]|nr:hypothetical protein [Crocinitomicaceae bacterium]
MVIFRSLLNFRFLYIIPILLIAFSCKKGEKNANEKPDTKVIPHVINLSGEGRLKSTVNMAWFGSDKDGYIDGFEFSLDNIEWVHTRKADSTFTFNISEGSDTADINFWVRAIDNKQERDPTPAYVRIPIKNTPPEVAFDEALSTKDTAFIVASFFWNASDQDGFDNLRDVELRLNNGSWYKIDKRKSNLSIVPDNPAGSGGMNAKVYFSPEGAEAESMDGLILGALNTVYIRSTDISGSQSEIDTLANLYFKPKSSDLIVIGGDRDFNSFYTQRISNVTTSFDYVDYTIDNGKWQPAFWATTFYLMISEYKKLCIFSDKNPYVNSSTGLSSLILESSARPVQDFTLNGGKVFAIGYFDNSKPLESTSPILGVYPIDSMASNTSGLSLQRSDTSLISQQTDYPDLGSNSFPLEFSPFYQSSDAVVLYNGDIYGTSYTGSKTVGVKKPAIKPNMVFISAALNKFDYDYKRVDSLFDQVLNKDFNW